MIRLPHCTSLCSTVLLLLGSFSTAAWADLPAASAEWQLEREDDGIRIYNTAVPDSGFEAFKAVTILDAPLSNIMAVMINPESCTEWVHGCSLSEGLDGGHFHDRLAYSVNDLPWPAADRDYVLRIQTRTETAAAGSDSAGEPASAPGQPQIVMELSVVPGERPKTDGRVRVEHSDTLYVFHATADNRTHMTWIQHSEPNGSLPSWLVNALAIDIPFNSLRQLEEVAQWDKYANHKLVFDPQSGQLVDVRLATPRGTDTE